MSTSTSPVGRGDSSFPCLVECDGGAVRLEDCPLPGSTSLLQLKDELTAAIRRRGREIHERKGYTSYGVASAAARIVRAVVRDELRIFMVSVRPAQEYGIGDVVLSVPSVIGRAGVDRQLLLRLSDEEQQRLERSATVLDDAYRALSGAESQA